MGGCVAKNTNPNPQKKITKGITTQDLIFLKEANIYADYDFGTKLGKGSYGEVFTGIHKISKQTRAIKKVNKEKALKPGEDKSKLLEEFHILKMVDHPNVMKLYEVYEDNEALYFVTELLSGGELLEKIVELERFGEKTACKIVYQILLAINYCHNQKIVHRDLKPQNVLIESKDDEIFVKIADFGIAKMIDNKNGLTEQVGTPLFVAPEIVLGNKYDEKCDVWSIGVITYMLLSGLIPFFGNSNKAIFAQILAGNYSFKNHKIWELISDEAKNFIRRTLITEASKRPSAEDLLKDPWITNLKEGTARDKNPELERQLKQKVTENLKNFSTLGSFQKTVLTYVSTMLSNEKEIKQMRELFLQMDTSGDGKISREELKNNMAKLPKAQRMTDTELTHILNEVDANCSGTIDYSEFITAFVDRERALCKKNLENAFAIIDQDKNGFITRDELIFVFGGASPENEEGADFMEKLLKEADGDGDDRISQEEFVKIMTQAIHTKNN